MFQLITAQWNNTVAFVEEIVMVRCYYLIKLYLYFLLSLTIYYSISSKHYSLQRYNTGNTTKPSFSNSSACWSFCSVLSIPRYWVILTVVIKIQKNRFESVLNRYGHYTEQIILTSTWKFFIVLNHIQSKTGKRTS